MTYSGTVKNGVVVFDGKPPLPEGVRVRIEPEAPAAGSLAERLLKHAGVINDLPADMAEKHDRLRTACHSPSWRNEASRKP